jgi:hypothetical protein
MVFSIVIIFFKKNINNYIINNKYNNIYNINNNIKHAWPKFKWVWHAFKSNLWFFFIVIIFFSNLLRIILIILIIINIIILNMPNSSLSGSGKLARPTVVGSGQHARLMHFGFGKNIRPTFFSLFLLFFSIP